MRIDPIGAEELPLTLATVKAHLRLDSDVGEEEDSLLLVYLRAAVSEAERATRRKIARQRYLLRGVASAGSIALPLYPVDSVERVEGPDGALTPDDYDLRSDLLPMRVEIASPPPGPLEIELYAGHSEGDVPGDVAALVLLLVGHRYEHREAVTVGVSASALPRAVHDLIWLLRVAL